MSPATETSAAAAASSSAVSDTFKASPNLRVVGVILAVSSGLLIGSSFVLKKKGLLRSQAGGELGEGVAYLKSALWWSGMIMMILGELCNFAAYAFIEAIVVTPLGALSVVVSAVLSSFFLKEKLSFFGWLGCALCILGSIIIALNGPHGESIGEIRKFQKLFLAPGFLAFGSVLIVSALVIIFYFAPRYGKKSMLWYISVCSMIGGLSVSVTTGLGAAIVRTAMGDNQFKYWFMYFLFGFVIVTLLAEIYYLNIALALFNTAMVTPTYYVIFTFFTLVTTIILFQGLKATAAQIISIVMAFLVICVGITILQMSKIDPTQFNKLDRRSTILLQAARQHTETSEEKGVTGLEDPGMDALRGSFGTIGSIIRARTMRRMSQSSQHARPPGAAAPWVNVDPNGTSALSTEHHLSGLTRHQLYDAPMPRDDTDSILAPSVRSQPYNTTTKRQTIKFDAQDLVHQYNRPGHGDSKATHEHRQALSSPTANGTYPPLPAVQPDNLLEMESPPPPTHALSIADNVAGIGAGSASGRPSSTTAVSGSTVDDKESLKGIQTLLFPSHLSEEQEVRSAPPTVYQRYRPGGGAGNLPARKDSRDIFDHTPNSARETLLSFPSVTDSARSQDWDEDDMERMDEKEQQQHKEKHKEKEKTRLSKRYPKGEAVDTEESESLWHKSLIEDELEDDSLPPNSTGIRLVQRK